MYYWSVGLQEIEYLLNICKKSSYYMSGFFSDMSSRQKWQDQIGSSMHVIIRSDYVFESDFMTVNCHKR